MDEVAGFWKSAMWLSEWIRDYESEWQNDDTRKLVYALILVWFSDAYNEATISLVARLIFDFFNAFDVRLWISLSLCV